MASTFRADADGFAVGTVASRHDASLDRINAIVYDGTTTFSPGSTAALRLALCMWPGDETELRRVLRCGGGRCAYGVDQGVDAGLWRGDFLHFVVCEAGRPRRRVMLFKRDGRWFEQDRAI